MAGGAVGIGLVAAVAEAFALSGSVKAEITERMIADNTQIQMAFGLFDCDSLEELEAILPTLASDPTAALFCKNAISSFGEIDVAAGQQALMDTALSLPVIATVICFVALGVGLYIFNKRKAKAIERQIAELTAQR